MYAAKIAGRKIRAYRKEIKKTQLAFASKCFMSESYLSKLECGKVVNPGLATLQYVANVMGITVDELIRDDQNVYLSDGKRDAEYQEYLEYKRRLDNMPEWRRERIKQINILLFMEEPDTAKTKSCNL